MATQDERWPFPPGEVPLRWAMPVTPGENRHWSESAGISDTFAPDRLREGLGSYSQQCRIVQGLLGFSSDKREVSIGRKTCDLHPLCPVCSLPLRIGGWELRPSSCGHKERHCESCSRQQLLPTISQKSYAFPIPKSEE